MSAYKNLLLSAACFADWGRGGLMQVMSKTLMFFGMVVTLFGPSLASAQTCDAILRDGVFREDKIKSDQSFGQEILDLFCSSNENYQEKSKRIGLKIPIKQIPLVGNYTDQNNNFNRAQACKSNVNRSTRNIEEDINKRYADSVLVEAWKFCIEEEKNASKSGLICDQKVEADSPEAIRISVAWRPTSKDQYAKINLQAQNITCQGMDVAKAMELEPYASKVFLCLRPSPSSVALMALNVESSSASCTIQVPAVKTLDPEVACMQAVKDNNPSPNSEKYLAGMRCCQQGRVIKQDLAVASLIEKQWSQCSSFYAAGKNELGRACTLAMMPVNAPKVSDADLPTIAMREQADSERRSMAAKMQLSSGGSPTCGQ